MSEISKEVTRVLYELSKADLKKARAEKGLATRVGMTIQALRKAVMETNIYQWSGLPHYFNGKVYVPLEVDEFKGVVYDVLLMSKAEASDFTQIEKIQRMLLQAVRSKPLEIRKDIVVFNNGVLLMSALDSDEEEDADKRRKKKPVFVAHSPELRQTTMCNFDYDPTAECPMWNRFLEYVLDNLQARMVLQEFMGAVFIDRRDHKFDYMLILIGNGSNGKSVVSETMRGIIGYDYTTAYGLDSLLVGTESLHNIARMNGMKANWCSEIQCIQAGRFSDKLKNLISGEPVECRQMYGMPFMATDIPVLMANCNTLPAINDGTYGMERRLVIIRFNVTIPPKQQDKQLLQKLRPEYSGIFNWIMEGRQRYIDQGYHFTYCKAIEKNIEAYKEASNNVAEFCLAKTYKPVPEDALQVSPYLMPLKSMYDEYCRWCISVGAVAFSALRFGNLLTGMGYQRARDRNGLKVKLYGEHALAMLNRTRKEELSRQLTENGGVLNGQELKNSRVFDIGDEAAARWWHLSRPYLVLIRKARYLDGVWHKELRLVDGRKSGTKIPVNVYDHIKLGQRLEALGIYDEKNGTLSERRQKQIKMARAFNEQMEKMKKPFRKLTGKKSKYPQGTVFVDPDWEYTPDNAETLLTYIGNQRSAEDIEKRAKAVTSDGKLEHRTKRQLVADTVESQLLGHDSAAVDPETGEVLTIDIDDEDLKITDSDE